MDWFYNKREDGEQGELIKFKIVGTGNELKAHKSIVEANLNLNDNQQNEIDINGHTEEEVAAFIKFLYFRNLDHVEDDEEDHTQTLFRNIGVLCNILNVKPELVEIYRRERQRSHNNGRRRQRRLTTGEEVLGPQNHGIDGMGVNRLIQQEPIDEEMGERNNSEMNHPEEPVNEVNQTDGNSPAEPNPTPSSTLHEEPQNIPRNIVSTLFKRESGIVSERVKDGSLMVRHAMLSRAPGGPKPIEIVQNTPITVTNPPTGEQGSAQWLRTSLGTSKKKKFRSSSNYHSSDSTKIYASCVDDYIVIHDGNEKRLFFTPKPNLSRGVRFRFHFGIPGTYAVPWSFAIEGPYWNHNCFPNKEGRVTESKPRMLLYDTAFGNRMCNYNTGEILTEMKDIDIHGLDLPSSALFSPPVISTFEKIEEQTGNIYWYCRRRRELDPPHPINSINQKIAIMEYSQFSVTNRIVIPARNSPFSSMEQFVIFVGIFIAADSTSVQLYDLFDEDDLHPNRSLIKINSAGADEINNTVTFHRACEPLFEIETRERKFGILEGIWPPCFLVQGIKSYQIKSMEDPRKIIYELDRTDSYKLRIHSYDPNARVIVSGLPHGIDIIHIDSRALKATLLLSTETFNFHSESDQTMTAPESPNPGRRRSTRTKRRVDYSQVENGNYGSSASVFAYTYNPRLNLLALCKASYGILRIVLLDNSTLRVLKRLQPIKLTVPAGTEEENNEWECSKLQVHLNETFICVRVRHTDDVRGLNSFQLYTGRLLGEVVPNLE